MTEQFSVLKVIDESIADDLSYIGLRENSGKLRRQQSRFCTSTFYHLLQIYHGLDPFRRSNLDRQNY